MDFMILNRSFRPTNSFSSVVLALIFAVGATFTVGCGGGRGTTFSGNTPVTVLLTSTANDQLSQFGLTFNSMALTNEEGATVSLSDTPQVAEFIHLNGTTEPLLTVNIPQGTYTSAIVSIGYSQFTCLAVDSSSHNFAVYNFANPVATSVSVTLPSPITITGASMALSLDLLVSKSASWTTCGPYNGIQPFSITPTFNLASAAISNPPANSVNGKATNLQGMVTSVDPGGDGFSVTAAEGPTGGTGLNAPARSWHATLSGSTIYQGITGSALLVPGLPMDMDVAIQQDGSLLATRVAVYDTNTTNLSIRSGPLLNTSELWSGQTTPTLAAFGFESLGHLELGGGGPYFSFDNAVFQTSGQLTNIPSLPFVARFTASNMIAGQNVYITTHAASAQSQYGYIPAASITLLPQTINGTIVAVSSEGGFTIYTVSLASYDLFPALAAQPGQIASLADPNSIIVYTDSSTQSLNTTPITVGSILRFNGMVFNDKGTLKMDCTQINDGIPE
jgi:hypothetical protein